MTTDFINTVLDGLMILINLSVMLIYSPLLTGLVFCSLSIYVTIRCSSYYFLERHTEMSLVHHAKCTSAFLETLQAMIPIKSFLKEQTRFHTWHNSYVDSLNSDIHVSRLNLIYHVANQLLFNIELIVVICVGASLVLLNKFSIGMLMAFLAYRLMLVNKASSFVQNVFDYKLIGIQLNRLSDILFQQPEVCDSGAGRIERVHGSVSLKNICFQYHSSDKTILNNISMDIQSGEKVAIIGPSGCGKSTLLKVMMGLLNQTSGEIFIDNISVKDFGLKNYRDLTASVMQEDVLLSGSILDNISFFDDDIDLERVYDVAKLAGIHDVIRDMPMGYETSVGELGSLVSGGQKQRILLARALYKRPKILFLDEATSHLDVDNEQHINQSLKSLAMTQIVVAHRQETIQMADRVIDFSVMNQIRIT